MKTINSAFKALTKNELSKIVGGVETNGDKGVCKPSSQIPMSTGDEAGVHTGISSGTTTGTNPYGGTIQPPQIECILSGEIKSSLVLRH